MKNLEEEVINSNFIELDKITGGWRKGELIIIASRPNIGKTTLGVSMIKNIAIHNEIAVAFFSLGMRTDQLTHCFLANISCLEMEKVVATDKGELADTELSLLNKAEKQLENAPLFLDDTTSLSVFELRAKARHLVREHNVKCIIIDYLQLMNAKGMNYSSREQEVGTISRSLRGLAYELNIPIIAFLQLTCSDSIENQSLETNPDVKRPQLSDLREFGAIEPDADVVCFIHRPECYGIYEDTEGNCLCGVVEIIVAKNRKGKTGDAKLKFCEKSVRFQNIKE